MDILEYADQVWRGDVLATDYWSGALRADGLQEVADGVHMWPAAGNVYVFETTDGLMMFDTGASDTAGELFEATRKVSSAPLRYAIYSHGHIDHIGGVAPFDEEARGRGWNTPTVVAHTRVRDRFDRYVYTNGYNTVINRRQFQQPDQQWPLEYRYPDICVEDRHVLSLGGLTAELSHGYGETDDAVIAWFPDKKIVCVGDFFIWMSPNAGNPQKVQRYARLWAHKLREIAGLGAEMLLPGHGLPIVGRDRVAEAMLTTAEYLEYLHDTTIEYLNQGAPLDTAIHGFHLPDRFREVPYLQPRYDEPEFVVRNAWRLYGGWYDGDPSNLKPAKRADIGRAVVSLAGGPDNLAARAKEELRGGNDRVAAKLIQLAVDAEPENLDLHDARVEIFEALRSRATSTMSQGVYAWAVAESTARMVGKDTLDSLREKAGAMGHLHADAGSDR